MLFNDGWLKVGDLGFSESSFKQSAFIRVPKILTQKIYIPIYASIDPHS